MKTPGDMVAAFVVVLVLLVVLFRALAPAGLSPASDIREPEVRMNEACAKHKGVRQFTDTPFVVCMDGTVVRWRD